ncbi:site-specific integrase [Methylobacterium sp. SD21]|uniref:site-specific integrase n=1 Tax=Methylobacterium litchii TaxID=3138810 RepID=UPI00313CD214
MPDTLPTEVASKAGDNLPAETTAIVRAYQRASKADSTVRAYTGDARVFQDWCARFGFRPLPASTEAVAGFLVHEAEAGRSASTIGKRLAAIRYARKLSGAANPTDDESVRAAIKGIRRRESVAPTQKAAATADLLAATTVWRLPPPPRRLKSRTASSLYSLPASPRNGGATTTTACKPWNGSRLLRPHQALVGPRSGVQLDNTTLTVWRNKLLWLDHI